MRKLDPYIIVSLIILLSSIIFAAIIKTTYISQNKINQSKMTNITDKPAANQLINSTSPYLLQHAYNPVNWHEWGEEAFSKAKRENKPILLSIGYSTCYWCHVMEREVFENEAIAQTMNESIISIKIDREQHPDVDAIYMTATQLITGGGGWPNNVFVNTDLEPFFAGTYFPPQDSDGRMGFASIIKKIKELWDNNRQAVEKRATELTQQIKIIKQKEEVLGDNSLPDKQNIKELFDFLYKNYDRKFGGFYQAPKFPHEDALIFLLNLYKLQNNQDALILAKTTLEKMSQGGIYDQVGGGFHRYSTDIKWQIPHFEKMLYNQALLSKAYLMLYQQSNSPIDKDVAVRTLNFTASQMRNQQGGFYSAFDAETNEAEGAYYVWEDQELSSILTESHYQWLKKYYGLAAIPHIQGHKNAQGKVLYLKTTIANIAAQENISYLQAINEKNVIMNQLLAARNKRKKPFLDDKIITAWNGLMIDSFAHAALITREESYAKTAQKAADFILENLSKSDGGLYRIWRQGKSYINATFEDYAFFIQGLISTYLAVDEKKYLYKAINFANIAQKLFWDDINGGYYFTDNSPSNQNLLIRSKNAADSAFPSANAVMLHALLDLYSITGDKAWKIQAQKLLKAFNQAIKSNPVAYTYMIDGLLVGKFEQDIVATGDMADSTVKAATVLDSKSQSLSTTSRVTVKIAENSVKYQQRSIKLTVEISINDGWHINSNPASLDFLIPTSITLHTDSQAVSIKAVNYPKAKNITSALGKLLVYQDKVLIPLELETATIDKVKNLQLIIQAQACKETSCLLPADFVVLVF